MKQLHDTPIGYIANRKLSERMNLKGLQWQNSMERSEGYYGEELNPDRREEIKSYMEREDAHSKLPWLEEQRIYMTNGFFLLILSLDPD